MIAAFLLAAARQSPAPELSSTAQALSPDGKLFAFSVSDGSVHLANLPDGKTVRVLAELPSLIDDLAFSPDSSSLAAVDELGGVHVLAVVGADSREEYPARPFVFHGRNLARHIFFVDSGRKLFIAGGRERARLIDRASGAMLREWVLAAVGTPEEFAALSTAAVSDDSKHLALGDTGGRFAVYSASTGHEEFAPLHKLSEIHALAFDPAARRIAVGADDCKVRVFALDAQRDPREFSYGDDVMADMLQVGSVGFSPDGRTLLACSFKFWEVRSWDIESGRQQWSFDYGGGNAMPVLLGCTPDGSRVVTTVGTVLSSVDGKRERDLTAGNPFGSERFHLRGGLTSVQSGSVLRVLDVSTGTSICEIPIASR